MLQSANGRPQRRDRGSKLTEFREFQDGEVIAGTRYRVLRLIGVGGMGSVYDVEHIELGKRFVLKALLRELSRREDLAQRLRNEWRALARLQHENIVNVTDAGTSGGGVPFYVMERLEGDTLAALLRRRRRIHVLEAVNIAASVLEALSAAHDIGIIHRDVKPANVFMVNGGGVKLLDFGIAKIADATSVVTARGLAVGTPRYMSPEQARGERVDGRSDVYASALILFEMIAGVGPFDDARDANELLLAHLAREAPPLSSLVMGVSPELERILALMLAKDCRQRPAHAREAAQTLREFALRQRSAPATDVPTAEAGYTGQTAPSPQRAVTSLAHESITRPERAARAVLAGQPLISDDTRTQRLSLLPETTQVTLSVNTGDSFSISAVPNTTFVSPPSFDGSTTLQMSAVAARPRGVPHPSSPPVERPERTETLGDFPPVPFELAATRTQVPLPERARPVSVTPPPMVDAGRSQSRPSLIDSRLGRWVGLAGGLAIFLVTGLVLTRAGYSGNTAAPTVPVRNVVPSKAGAETFQPGRSPVESAPPPTLVVAQPSGGGPSVTSSSSPKVPASAAISSGQPQSLRAILAAKHLHIAAARAPAPPVSGGFASLPRTPRSAGAARPSDPALPASGL